MRIVAFLTILICGRAFAQLCSEADQPDDLAPVQVYKDDSSGDDPLYTIAEGSPGNDYAEEGSQIQVATLQESSGCPPECGLQLIKFNAEDGTNILHVKYPNLEIVPAGYDEDGDATPLYCMNFEGNCGADQPIYRYFKIGLDGKLHHAYSLGDDELDDAESYTKELSPLCYGWAADRKRRRRRGTVSHEKKHSRRQKRDLIQQLLGGFRDESKAVCSGSVEENRLVVLNAYDNGLSGTDRDHWYTPATKDNGSKDLYDYVKIGELGKVLDKDPGTCGCMVELTQQLDKQGGMFHRIDHKLSIADKESNRMFESYAPTGESIFCAAEPACGATIPLYKTFNYLNVDSTLQTDSSLQPFAYHYPWTPLCYIWPINTATTTAATPTAVVTDGPDETSTEAEGEQATTETTKKTPVRTKDEVEGTTNAPDDATTEGETDAATDSTDAATDATTDAATDAATTNASEDDVTTAADDREDATTLSEREAIDDMLQSLGPMEVEAQREAQTVIETIGKETRKILEEHGDGGEKRRRVRAARRA